MDQPELSFRQISSLPLSAEKLRIFLPDQQDFAILEYTVIPVASITLYFEGGKQMKTVSRLIAALLLLAVALGLTGFTSPAVVPLSAGGYTTAMEYLIWDTRTNQYVNTVSKDSLDVAKLGANQIYVPRLKVTNNSSYTRYPTITATINGDDYDWDSTAIAANSSHGFISTSAYEGAGFYVYIFYVDNQIAEVGYYEITDSRSSAAKPAPASGTLSGRWADNNVSTRAGHNSAAFILDSPVRNCTQLTVDLRITDYTGYPFDYWYLDGRDLNGNWTHLGSFKLEKKDVGTMKSYVVTFKKVQTFDALCIVNSNSYNAYTVSYDLSFRDPKTR